MTATYFEVEMGFGEALSSVATSPAAAEPKTALRADSRARYASWSDADDRRKGRNPREQVVAAAVGPSSVSNVLEFRPPDSAGERLFLLQNFKVDGATLRVEHKQCLDSLAEWMRSRPQGNWQIFVEAHASRTGTASHDDALSEDRYLATRASLESRLLSAGIAAARLRVYGEGVGFRNSPLPGEDPRARSVFVAVQPNPSPFPRTTWPPPFAPVPWPPVRPRPIPVPPPNVTVTDIFDYVPIEFVLEHLQQTAVSLVMVKRPAFRDLASLAATPAGAVMAEFKKGGTIQVDPKDATKFKTRVRMQLAFPANATDPTRPAGTGRLPLAVLLHGNHPPYGTTKAGVLVERESFRGYRYLQEDLARAGIASISVDTNIANATDSFIELRADLVLEALKLLKRQGGVLLNRFNFEQVALMGHSRGGDAIVRVVKKNRAAPAASRFGILTACSLSPTDITGSQVAAERMFLDQYDLNFYSVLYGALDGDVSGIEGSHAVGGTGFRHYDRARCQKALVFAERCCHNSFNSVWYADGVESGVRAVDRISSGPLVDETTHQRLAIEYIGTQFKAELKGTASKTSLFNGTTASATGLATAILWAFGNPLWHVDDFESPAGNPASGGRRLNSGTTISDFGSIQIPKGVSINDHVLEQSQVAHVDTSAATGASPGVEMMLPAGKCDLTSFTTLAMDVGAFFDTKSEATINAGTPPTFRVILQDNKGATASAAASRFSPSPRKPFFHVITVTKNKVRVDVNVTALHLETLAIPLTTFTGIDLSNVVKIGIEVAPPKGHLFIDDIKLAGF